jgi:hypothetical protein
MRLPRADIRVRMKRSQTSLKETLAMLRYARSPWFARFGPEEDGPSSEAVAAFRGLSRADALILAAANEPPSGERTGFTAPVQLWLRLWVLPRALRRLEDRKLVQPGWSTAPTMSVDVTALGVRAAQLAKGLMDLEKKYADGLRRRLSSLG